MTLSNAFRRHVSHSPTWRSGANGMLRRHPAGLSREYSDLQPLRSILIANRGEIALRVGRTASKDGIKVATIYTDPDATSQHALSSPFNVNLGATTAYLDGERIIQVAKEQGCAGIHPGYGFLSENADFAQKCADAGLVFIGPPWTAIDAMGSKSRSKEIMTEAGVPCIPGYHGVNQQPSFLQEQAQEIGYPVLLKAVKGGGGKGMRIVRSEGEFASQLESAMSEARNSFGDDVMLVEKYITTPRHIEVQVFADKHGNCVALGERDCSIQRRHQKILEESPAPHLPEETRQDLWEKARAAALAVGYEGAGTVEFIFDNETGEFFFMEMNTRLQVEHPVTEMVTGTDLVKWQLMIAAGEPLPMSQKQIEEQIGKRGHAIEARIYAENPHMNFIPDSGKLLHLRTPGSSEDVRIDAGFIAGDEVSAHYDPMIAKLIVRGDTRQQALQRLHKALEDYEVAGPITNIEFLKRLCISPAFVAGDVETGYIEKHRNELFAYETPSSELLAQAVLGLLLEEQAQRPLAAGFGLGLGFGSGFQRRQFQLSELPADADRTCAPVTVSIHQSSPKSFAISVSNDGQQPVEFSEVTSTFDQTSRMLRSFYAHTRLDTRFIRDESTVTLFDRGHLYRFVLTSPKWVEEALGTKAVTNSVLAPMPCKVLRVEVQPGDTVKRDQALVVIESMKMETVIRSPGDGMIVSKIVHKAGDVVKAGTALVEFEEEMTDKGDS